MTRRRPPEWIEAGTFPHLDPLLGNEWNPARRVHPRAPHLAEARGLDLLTPHVRANLAGLVDHVRAGRVPNPSRYTGYEVATDDPAAAYGVELAVVVTTRRTGPARHVDDDLDLDAVELVHIVDRSPHVLEAGTGSTAGAHDLALSLLVDALHMPGAWGDALALVLAPAVTWALVAALPAAEWQVDLLDVLEAALDAAGEPADRVAPRYLAAGLRTA